MDNLKTKGIFTLLFTLTIFIALTFGNIFAVENKTIGEIQVLYNNEILLENSTTVIEKGDKIKITVSPEDSVCGLGGEFEILNSDEYGIGFYYLIGQAFPNGYGNMDLPIEELVPGNAGKTVKFTAYGMLKNYEEIGDKVYYFKISGDSIEDTTQQPGNEVYLPNIEQAEENLSGVLSVKMDGKVIKTNETMKIIGGEVIKITGTPVGNFETIRYKWDNELETIEYGSSAEIPVWILDDDRVHTLKIYGRLKDGAKTATKTYRFIYDKEEELKIEPWMRENENAEGLLVSLRNSIEEEKGNKNFYSLNEEVKYYIDYKNFGEKVKKDVKISLKLPFEFEIVNDAAGVVSKSNKTITWTFEDGLESGMSGTKEVTIKYKKFNEATTKYQLTYPQVSIFVDSKKVHTSASINYIYLSNSTIIEEEHEPYMFGDEGVTMFRPDDTITRAEGALVLTRAFGIENLSNDITDKFVDIDETYYAAQKAITAATNLGIINGYEDGTYRPNAKMTRAEFMKIIASYVEYTSQKENIEGLKIDENKNIKIYNNPLGNNHWATSYVTLLTRLNMTPIDSINQDLRLNDEITRAEVTQLVNLYLFRAPAKIVSGMKGEFVDVPSDHELYEDIIEATRGKHKYVISEDARERRK